MIDITHDLIIKEAYGVGQMSQGAITYENLLNMPIDRYMKATQEAVRLSRDAPNIEQEIKSLAG